ncbi:diguanylate cyclase [Micromonospora sp. BRA006-A]|nr:diguanylate cyclase [Micromonospora sp. BRA006-A]
MTNVLANLIAAAIVYVLAAAAGLLPRDPALILAALLLVSVAAAMVLLVLITTNAFADRADVLGGWMAIALGTPILTSAVVYALRERDPAAGIVGGLIGAGSPAQACRCWWPDGGYGGRPTRRPTGSAGG